MEIKRILVLLLPLVLFSSCGQNKYPQRVNFRGQVFGTYYSVSYFEDKGINYKGEVEELLEEFNNSLSYYKPNSLISQINRNEADIADEYFKTVFIRSEEIYQATDGAFDVTVGPLVNAWGFGFSKKDSVTTELVDSLLLVVGMDKVSLQGDHVVKEDPRIQFDFNAIAKGYASDVVGKFLESKGIENYLVEIGGDLIAKGKKPDGSKWKIGLEIPAENIDDPQQWEYFVELTDQAVATSGSYRKYYEQNGQRFSHTINPSTGYPVDHNLLSVSVFAPDAITADAYATAFMVMGLERSIAFVENHPELEAYFTYSQNSEEYGTYATPGLTLLK